MKLDRKSFLVWMLIAWAFPPGISPAIYAQTPSDADHAVQLVLEQSAHGFYSSTGEKELERNGDACAVAVTKIFAGRELTDADIRTITLIIRFSFEKPEIIENADERKPRTALFLLNSLAHSTADPTLQTDINSTKSFVQDRYAAYAKRSPAQ